MIRYRSCGDSSPQIGHRGGLGEDTRAVCHNAAHASKRDVACDNIALDADARIEKVTAEPSGAEDEIIERLRAIGYLEDD